MKVIQRQLSPTPNQVYLLNKQLDEHRHLYNSCLEIKINEYKNNKKSISCFDLIKSEIPKLKENGSISNYSSLQQTLRRLDKTYQSFFRNGYGFPRFKNKDRFKTIEFGRYGDGCKIKNGLLYIQNVGLIKCLHLPEIKSIKNLSISLKAGTFYVNIIHEEDRIQNANKTNSSIGLDFGLKTFITGSDGSTYDSPKFHKKSLKEEAKLNRKIQKNKKGSKDREKYKRAMSKHKRRVSNRRKDSNHKLSRKIINSYDVICIENIKINDLNSKISNINRAYRDVAFCQFQNFLTYKAEDAGKILVKVDPHNTTKECYECGKLIDKTLKERVHKCSCGNIEDRDVNAAKNILRRGLASLGGNP